MSKRPDLVPQPYVIEMANLQDKVNPLPFEEMAESLDLACICKIRRGKSVIGIKLRKN